MSHTEIGSVTLVHDGGMSCVPVVAQSYPPTKCVETRPPSIANDTRCCALEVLHSAKYALAPPTNCSLPGRSASADSEKLLS